MQADFGVDVLVEVKCVPQLLTYQFSVSTQIVKQAAAYSTQDLKVNVAYPLAYEDGPDVPSPVVTRRERCLPVF